MERAKKQSKLIAVCFALFTALLVVSGSIAVPLLCRPFYYAHISPMGLGEEVGLTREEVVQTYNEVMDYCLGLTEEFTLTHLIWSDEGASHFADTQLLFLLDLRILLFSAAALVLLWAMCRFGGYKAYRFKGRVPAFWAAAGLGAFFAVCGVIGAVDFDFFFVLFHLVLFPGKDNWLFSYKKDPVIYLLPQDFFMHCALLIFLLIAASCAALLLAERKTRKHTAA